MSTPDLKALPRPPPSAPDRAPVPTVGPVSPCGFGPILQQELALQAAVEVQRGSIGNPPARDLERVLRHQQAQLSEDRTALDRRCDELPHGERFRRPGWRHLSPTQGRAERSLPGGGLEALAARHLVLAGHIRDVMVARHQNDTNSALEEVARHHEEMAGVLAALAHEEEAEHAPAASAADGPALQAAAASGAQRWENEGGSLDD